MADESVLVVDDSPTILKLAELVLTKAGYRVTTAAGGEAGLLAAKAEHPSLILLDYLMPDLKGDDVCRVMSGDTALARVPVVVMSARTDEVGERFALMTNVVDQITKPFSPEALLTVVTHSLQKHGKTVEDDPPLPVGRPDVATEPAPADAALAGDLGVISIADVLGLLQDQAQTGTLTLAQGERRLDLHMQSGRIDFASARGVADEFLLGRFLVQAGQITAPALELVLEERKGAAEAPPVLGADLLARGLVVGAGLKKAMGLQTTALVYEGLRWGSGRFWFYPATELPPLARDAGLALAADALIMEGLRRVDEWRLIEREVGDFERVFVRNDERLVSFGRGQLLREELAALEHVNGRNTVKDIVYLTKMGSFDVTKMLYRLLRNKLIRPRVAPVAV